MGIQTKKRLKIHLGAFIHSRFSLNLILSTLENGQNLQDIQGSSGIEWREVQTGRRIL